VRSPFRRSACLAACAAVVLAATAGCGGGGSSTSPPSSPSPQAPSSSQYQALVPLIDCLRQHGLNLPTHPTLADVRQVYQALTADQQQSVIAACRDLLPSGMASARPSDAPSSAVPSSALPSS